MHQRMSAVWTLQGHVLEGPDAKQKKIQRPSHFLKVWAQTFELNKCHDHEPTIAIDWFNSAEYELKSTQTDS